jgi:hypothetical protein
MFCLVCESMFKGVWLEDEHAEHAHHNDFESLFASCILGCEISLVIVPWIPYDKVLPVASSALPTPCTAYTKRGIFNNVTRISIQYNQAWLSLALPNFIPSFPMLLNYVAVPLHRMEWAMGTNLTGMNLITVDPSELLKMPIGDSSESEETSLSLRRHSS